MNSTPAPEEEEPRTAPRGRPWWLSPPVVAVFLLALGVLGIWGGRMDSGRRSREALASAQVAVQGVDAVILSVDAIVESTPTARVGRRATDVHPKLPEARRAVSEAVRRLDEAGAGFSPAEAGEAVALRTGLKERAALLKEAAVILPAARDAGAAVGPIKRAWSSVAVASELSNKAAQQFNDHSTDGVTESTRLTKLAASNLDDARDSLLEAREAWTGLDLKALTAYVDARRALTAKSLAIDRTWLAGDPEKANLMLDAYAAEAAEIGSRPAARPGAEMKALIGAYDKAVGGSRKSYRASRQRAAEADGHLPPISARGVLRAGTPAPPAN